MTIRGGVPATRQLRQRLRASVMLLAVVLTVAGCGSERVTAAGSPGGDATRDAVVVGFDDVRRLTAPPDPDQYAAWERAVSYAESHGDVMARPYIDPDSGVLVLSALDAGQHDAARAAATAGDADVETSFRVVAHSYNRLQKVADEVLRIPEIETAGTGPYGPFGVNFDDPENRVLVFVAGEPKPALLRALGNRYGDAVAVLRTGGGRPRLR